MLSPRGMIANDERKLFFDSLALMLIVVLPVIIMSIFFAVKYRNRPHLKNRDYRPNWSHNTLLEIFWWGIPIIIVTVLGIFVWNKSHSLDPYRKLNVKGKPIIIQAIALRWKWLFIYPTQHIATLNYVYLPANRPVEFQITADAPMSSFVIPRLGGQIYAMAGMRTRLHLYSSIPGTYEGLNAQYNGTGFSDMHFKAHVITEQNFTNWVKNSQGNSNSLNVKIYKMLRKPTIAAPTQLYSSVYPDLFKKVMLVYMKDQSLN
jgi:cytochrome o ubiquinol oxidase subunit 2